MKNIPKGLYIKVDMDYCVDPLWISNDEGGHWVNDHLPQYQDCISTELYELLLKYQHYWECDLWQIDTDMIDKEITRISNSDVFSIYLAERLQKEWPECQIYAGFIDNYNSDEPEYKVVKIEN